MDGLASCEALPGYMIGGAEENHEILQSIQAVSGPWYETRPTQIHRAASVCLMATNGGDGQHDCSSDVIRCSFRRSQLIAIGFKRHLGQDKDFLND
jgi:hypothetical protein